MVFGQVGEDGAGVFALGGGGGDVPGAARVGAVDYGWREALELRELWEELERCGLEGQEVLSVLSADAGGFHKDTRVESSSRGSREETASKCVV